MFDKIEVEVGKAEQEVTVVVQRSKENMGLIIGLIALALFGLGMGVFRSVNRTPRHELYTHSVSMFYTPDHRIVYDSGHGQFWWLNSSDDVIAVGGTIAGGNWTKGRALTEQEQAGSTLIHETIAVDENQAPTNSIILFKNH